VIANTQSQSQKLAANDAAADDNEYEDEETY